MDLSFDDREGVAPGYAPRPIWSITVDAEGRVVIQGGFESVQGVPAPGVARLLSDGTVDPGYVYRPEDVRPHFMAWQPDGKLLRLLGGECGPIDLAAEGVLGAVEPEPPRLVREFPDGTLDGSFGGGLPPGFEACAIGLQPDGWIIVAGGIPRTPTADDLSLVGRAVLRLEPDGALDPTFHEPALGLRPLESTAGVAVSLHDMVVAPDGRIYIGGFFTDVDGVARADVARLRADGTLDATFPRSRPISGCVPAATWTRWRPSPRWISTPMAGS